MNFKIEISININITKFNANTKIKTIKFTLLKFALLKLYYLIQ